GTIEILPNGDFTFTPTPDYFGPVPVITYTVNDGTGDVDGTLTLGPVSPVNDAPVATPATAVGDEDNNIPLALTGTDVDGTVDFVTVTTLPPVTEGVLYFNDG